MVTVLAKNDLINRTTNAVEVPAGTVGTVANVQIPPNPTRLQVDFIVNAQTVTKWVIDQDVTFVDGPIGLIKAVMERTEQIVTGIEYPDVISTTDLIISDTYSVRRDKLKVTFLSGLVLYLTIEANTGDFLFELDFGV